MLNNLNRYRYPDLRPNEDAKTNIISYFGLILVEKSTIVYMLTFESLNIC